MLASGENVYAGLCQRHGQLTLIVPKPINEASIWTIPSVGPNHRRCSSLIVEPAVQSQVGDRSSLAYAHTARRMTGYNPYWPGEGQAEGFADSAEPQLRPFPLRRLRVQRYLVKRC